MWENPRLPVVKFAYPFVLPARPLPFDPALTPLHSESTELLTFLCALSFPHALTPVSISGGGRPAAPGRGVPGAYCGVRGCFPGFSSSNRRDGASSIGAAAAPASPGQATAALPFFAAAPPPLAPPSRRPRSLPRSRPLQRLRQMLPGESPPHPAVWQRLALLLPMRLRLSFSRCWRH